MNTVERIGMVLDQASYALKYQHGENIMELQKACNWVNKESDYIFKAVKEHAELLEALKDMVRFNVNSPEFLGAKTVAERLIAKAEGSSLLRSEGK